MLNFVSLIKEDLQFRRRLKNYSKVDRYVKFKKDKMFEKITEFLPEHILASLKSEAEILAFVDFEEIKEILSRSYFPKVHSNKLKFQSLMFYLLEPENYRDEKGSLMLRSTESINKDHQEFSELLLDESLKIISFSYEAKRIYSPNKLKDRIEIIIDSFFLSTFEIAYEGHMVEKKINFLIPSRDYTLMINLRIKTKKGNLYRKVKVRVDELKRGCMNLIDIFEENETGGSLTHLETSGKIGLYIL